MGTGAAAFCHGRGGKQAQRIPAVGATLGAGGSVPLGDGGQQGLGAL